MFSVSNFIMTIIEKSSNVENLPKIDLLLSELKDTNNKILEIVAQNNYALLQELYKLHNKYENLEEEITLRRKIDSGTITFLFFIYSIGSAIIGLFFSISVFLTTIGTLGHTLLLVSMMGGLITLVVGLMSLKREHSYILSLAKKE
jgi:hypothetical protein